MRLELRRTPILSGAILALLFAPVVSAQSKTAPTGYAPPPDPGYSLYYRDSTASPNLAARWGYHEGWTDGRHDRNQGDSLRAQDKEHYLNPPEHQRQTNMTRHQYEMAYRTAYLHGYEHGSRL